MTKVKKESPAPSLEWEPEILIFNRISEIRDMWNDLAPNNIFLQDAYLSVVERYPPKGLTPFYALVRDDEGQYVGKIYFQLKKFKAQESLTFEKGSKCPSFFSTLGYYLKEYVAKKVEFKALGCGNLMLSGQHAFYFREDIPKVEQHIVVDMAIKELSELLSSKDENPSVVLLKDFPEDEAFTKKTGVGTQFYDFKVQPNMVLDIREDWESLDDYLSAMTSKYRVRYKRAKKKQGQIYTRELNYEEIVDNKDRMFDLYTEIANGAGFNLFILSPDYIPELKRVLRGNVQITGYYKGDNLIGYTTLIKNGDETEAHFLGFENDLNYKHQLYLNMLYDMVDTSIQWGVEKLNFSRTAMEIKSSVGAEPVPLNCYIRHQKAIRNKFLPHLFDYLKPDEDWIQRHPFKDQ
ncbi:MAG: GNAT family N-acetyltransferase [Saprospiraceae bacterium]|nr:GNAT family N-acetyltransferase [Saprospiraceae bacterium]